MMDSKKWHDRGALVIETALIFFVVRAPLLANEHLGLLT